MIRFGKQGTGEKHKMEIVPERDKILKLGGERKWEPRRIWRWKSERDGEKITVDTETGAGGGSSDHM